jgi:hypothetical protein
MDQTAATIYLKERGETAVQSMKWAYEPKLELSPGTVFEYGKMPPSTDLLAKLPPNVRHMVLRRRVAQVARRQKPMVSDEAIDHLMGQALPFAVNMLVDPTIMAERLELAIRATVPPFPQGPPAQLAPATMPAATPQDVQPQPAPGSPQQTQMVLVAPYPPVPQSPGPPVHYMAEGDTPRQPAASAPTTPADREVKAVRSHAAGGLSPSVAEPDDKRQKAGSALAPFKVSH